MCSEAHSKAPLIRPLTLSIRAHVSIELTHMQLARDYALGFQISQSFHGNKRNMWGFSSKTPNILCTEKPKKWFAFVFVKSPSTLAFKQIFLCSFLKKCKVDPLVWDKRWQCTRWGLEKLFVKYGVTICGTGRGVSFCTPPVTLTDVNVRASLETAS